jgi:outer membrane phospholipase A
LLPSITLFSDPAFFYTWAVNRSCEEGQTARLAIGILGFEASGKETWVMRLMKSTYGMRQASRRWNETFNHAVLEMGFVRLPCEWCVYVRKDS